KRLAVSYALMVEAGRMTVDVSSSPQNPVQFIEMFLLKTYILISFLCNRESFIPVCTQKTVKRKMSKVCHKAFSLLITRPIYNYFFAV
ncbi:hypothetical protein, partial [Enterobacter hormaechei]|uniref:hypothetical protein n=1 Tax=Enterobacter hormaechei TaxID=158836 RepID=UPI003D6E8A82